MHLTSEIKKKINCPDKCRLQYKKAVYKIWNKSTINNMRTDVSRTRGQIHLRVPPTNSKGAPNLENQTTTRQA